MALVAQCIWQNPLFSCCGPIFYCFWMVPIVFIHDVKVFKQELIDTNSPFKALLAYLDKEIQKYKEAERESLVMKEKQTETFKVDYKRIKNLVQNYDVIDCSSYSRSFTS